MLYDHSAMLRFFVLLIFTTWLACGLAQADQKVSAARSRPQASEQLTICTYSGCRPVSPGCKIKFGNHGKAKEICP